VSARDRFAAGPVARLATASAGGEPHVVPIVFAVDGDAIYSAVDGKPKRSRSLRRLANIEGNPRVSVLVDSYADDWSQLWWVRADGICSVHESSAAAVSALRAKYPQYREVPLDGPFLHIAVTRWSDWQASAQPPSAQRSSAQRSSVQPEV
jgi:PPOX class probable F420-dependent enzyme